MSTQTEGVTMFTPGPWQVVPAFHADADTYAYGVTYSNAATDEDYVIAAVATAGPRYSSLANAALIAAAPDLYRTLFDLGNAVLRWKVWRGSEIPDEMLDAATAALRKAEGLP